MAIERPYKEEQVHMPSFWTEGAKAYEGALRKEYEAECARLQARLDQCDEPVERKSIVDELEQLRRTFETRLKAIDRSLFSVE